MPVEITITRTTSNGTFAITTHDAEFTHAQFGANGIICPIDQVFDVVAQMNKTPTKLLRKGWHKTGHERSPTHGATWVEFYLGCWCKTYYLGANVSHITIGNPTERTVISQRLMEAV